MPPHAHALIASAFLVGLLFGAAAHRILCLRRLVAENKERRAVALRGLAVAEGAARRQVVGLLEDREALSYDLVQVERLRKRLTAALAGPSPRERLDV